MTSIRERVERCAMHPDAVHELVREIICECAGVAATLWGDVDRGSDRYSDYERGKVAAARHIERRIRELLA